MKIPILLRNTRKPEAQVKNFVERTHYGIKFFLPEKVSEKELLRILVRIPPDVYRLPPNQGAALDFGERLCSKSLILHMINSIVWEKGIKIIAWLSRNEESVELFKSAGLCVNEPADEIQTRKPEEPVNDSGPELRLNRVSALKVVYNSMRSGQRVEAEGDILVLGHLNPGAEVIAGGSIIVAGRMLGIVHAGAFGRTDIFVWAGGFETPQVRIGTKLCYADAKSTSCWHKCVVITLEDGTPVIRENKFMSMEKK